MTIYKPMLSQINGGAELRSDVNALQKSYDAAKVITTVSKGEGNYNADELFKKIQGDITALDSKTESNLESFKNKVVKDIVKVEMTATYEVDHFTVALPEGFDSLVPSADKGTPVAIYNLDNSAVIGEDGEQLTINLTDMTLSGTPSKIDPEGSAGLGEGQIAYKPIQETFKFKCFPVGAFSLFNIPDNYLLDNSEIQLIHYDKALHSIVADLAQDQSLIDKISGLVGEEAVASQINKVKAELVQTDEGLKQRATAIEVYVKEAGLDANSKKVINVADGVVVSEGKDAEIEGKLSAATVKITLPVEHVQEFALNGEAMTEFVLEAKPNSYKVTMNVNGIVYEEGMGAFNVDRESENKLTWVAPDFELKQDVAEKVFVRFVEDKESSIALTLE